MIINVNTITGLFIGFRNEFNKGFAGVTPQWKGIAQEIPSKTDTNSYPFMGTFPQLREWVGDRVIKNLRGYDYTLKNVPFEATVEVPVPTIINDQHGVFKPMMEQMGYSAGMHPDELVFGAMASGATDLCYDGQAFFDASHPIIVDGAASTTGNYDATGGGNLWMLFDSKKPMKPLIYQKRLPYNFVTLAQPNSENVFHRNKYVYGAAGYGAAGYGLWQLAYGSLNAPTAANVDTYVAAMKALKDDQGHPLGIVPDTIAFGATNWAAIRDLIELEKLASGASNPWYKKLKTLESPFLT
jgi:phage major head subunit gpT-like protein